MPASTTATVQDYLASLPAERRTELDKVRAVILRSLPDGYEETIASGMISYAIPLTRYPQTYNGQPLPLAALAAQKNYNALYLMTVYMNPPLEDRLRQGFADAGKKLDMGKSCVRFRKADDLALTAVADVIGSTTVDDYIRIYETSRSPHAKQ